MTIPAHTRRAPRPLIVRIGGLCLLLAMSMVTADTPPAQGMFLLAKRGMVDPNFRHTVILLLRHGEKGSLGLVVNRPSEVALADALPGLTAAEGTPHRISLGGPVALNRAIYLVRGAQPADTLTHVVGELSFGMDRELLENLLTERQPTTGLRVYAGHAGWSPGQLQREIDAGGWLAVEPGRDLETIFAESLDTLWRVLIDRHDPQGLLVLHPGDHYGSRATPMGQGKAQPRRSDFVIAIFGLRSAPHRGYKSAPTTQHWPIGVAPCGPNRH